MIIKQTPSFIPILKDSSPRDGLRRDASRQVHDLESFALLLHQAPHPGGGLPGMSTALPGLAGTSGEHSEGSDFTSILTTLMQLATIPTGASASPAEPPAQRKGIRQAVSAYAPQYSREGFRQKIDFGNKATFPQGVSGLDIHGPVSGPHSSLRTNALALLNESTPKAVAHASGPVDAHPANATPGFLAAHFESKGKTSAIGYDRRGGTCYGIYQLSSRMGTMDVFLKHLDRHAPEWSARLRAAGPANTRGRVGAMPREWQRISREDPAGFARLQHDFVHEHYYKPAARAVQRRIGLEQDNVSPALREVIWSTAVQHGVAGAANIFEWAAARLGDQDLISGETRAAERELIQAVYAERGRRFTGSSRAVRSSVRERLAEEMQLALALLPQAMDRQV
jgi:hypothetical protein